MSRIQETRQSEAAACEAMAAIVTEYDLRWAAAPSKPYPVEDLGALPIGWMPLFERLVRRLIQLGWDRQIAIAKEKMGILLIAIGDQDSRAMRVAIDQVERRATRTCDVCGAPGELWQVPRIAARCRRHAPPDAPRVVIERDGARTILLRKSAPRKA